MWHWYLAVSKLRFIYIFIVNALMLCVVLALGYVYYNLFLYKNNSEIVLYFPYGTTITEIASTMEDTNVLEDKRIFILAAKFAQWFHKPIISGEYRFEIDLHPYQALHKLTKGKRVLRKVTIPEGLTVKAAMEIINNTPGLTGEYKEQVRECNILPETYSYHYGDSIDSVVRAMKAAFQRVTDDVMAGNQSGLRDINEIITLASIVEKETRIDSERPRVAGVYLNRLKIDMPLQADPTVIYGMSDGLGVIDRPLTREDLKIDSPYNTYTRGGLPPTPIACPGKASILATANPERHEYLYFVADSLGGHIFAKTLEQHNQNNAARKAVAQELLNNNSKKT